ncbi:hypothetical protein [Streptomyces erythrochromogenes]|uniref:hypothetical protein n=1 Tax=Streptomyces erythrochromogenes TaxID=285574 RepID=UPI001FD81041|nr:hypothetical protein [Streptomyces erythrochromogenes]
MATKLLAHGMGTFYKDCEHAQSRWSKCPHEYKIRYRSAAGKQTEEAGFSTQEKAIARLTRVYQEKKAAPRNQSKAERIQKYGAMQFREYTAEWKAGQRDLAESSLRTLESLLEHHILPTLGSRRMSTFDHKVVDNSIRTMERNGEAFAVNLNNLVASDVYRVTQQVKQTTKTYGRLKHRKPTDYRHAPFPARDRDCPQVFWLLASTVNELFSPRRTSSRTGLRATPCSCTSPPLRRARRHSPASALAYNRGDSRPSVPVGAPTATAATTSRGPRRPSRAAGALVTMPFGPSAERCVQKRSGPGPRSGRSGDRAVSQRAGGRPDTVSRIRAALPDEFPGVSPTTVRPPSNAVAPHCGVLVVNLARQYAGHDRLPVGERGHSYFSRRAVGGRCSRPACRCPRSIVADGRPHLR